MQRLLSDLRRRRYLAGQTLLITFAAGGYRDERIAIRFRYGRLPAVALLR